MKLANEENVELTDEQLEFLGSGGCCSDCCGKGPDSRNQFWKHAI